jgi:hypothetical protein
MQAHALTDAYGKNECLDRADNSRLVTRILLQQIHRQQLRRMSTIQRIDRRDIVRSLCTYTVSSGPVGYSRCQSEFVQ